MAVRERDTYSLTRTICVHCSVLGCNSKLYLTSSIFEKDKRGLATLYRPKGWVVARHPPNHGRPICFLHKFKFMKAFKFKPDTGDVTYEEDY